MVCSNHFRISLHPGHVVMLGTMIAVGIVSQPALGQSRVACDVTTADRACGIQFSADTSRFSESSGAVSLFLTVDRPSTRAFTVVIAAQPGTATAPDYTLPASAWAGGTMTVTFSADQTSAVVPLQIRQDTNVEGNEWFTLRVQSVTNGHTTGPRVLSRIVIVDDERSSILATRNDNQTWFIGEPIGKPVGVELSTTACTTTKVVFRPLNSGAVVIPDTARGGMVNGRCFATTNWRLSSVVGKQGLEARVGNSVEVLNAFARRPARLVVGLAVAPQDDLVRYRVRTRSVEVQRTTTAAGGVTIDSTFQRQAGPPDTVAFVDAQLQTDAWGGVSFPFPSPSIHQLRFFAGASVLKPSRRFYVGLHALQILWPSLMEGSTIGFGAGVRLAREDVADIGSAGCDHANPCKKIDNTYDFFMSVTIDTAAAIGSLAALFKP